MADKEKIAGEILGGMGPGLLSGIGAALQGPKKPSPQASPDTTTRSGVISGPAAKPSGFKDGGVVEKTGVAKVHKGEVVIPAKGKGMAWKDATKHLGGKSKGSKKEVREIRTRKGASGGYIHEHHHTDPDANPMEEHTSPDQAGMVQHMLANMPDAGGGDPNAAAPPQAGPPQVAPAAAPAAPPGPPGAM